MVQSAKTMIRHKSKQDIRRFPSVLAEWLRVHCGSCPAGCVQIGCGFLLSFSELAGIPSGFGAAWMAACAVAGKSLLLPMAGCLLSFPMRLLWGLPPAWHMLLTMMLLLPAQRMLFHAGTMRLMLWTVASLLPGVIWAVVDDTQRSILLAAASAAVSALAAPVMVRVRQLLGSSREISTVEEYLAVGYMAALLLCGGARMMLVGVNIGVFGVAFLTLSAALWHGAAAGCITGVVGGSALALQGIPLEMSICLAAGGFIAGVVQQYGKRFPVCLSFMMTTLLAMYLNDATGYGASGAGAAAALLMMVMPSAWRNNLQAFAIRFSCGEMPQDAYASARLERWEATVAEIAASMPTPQSEMKAHPPAWWRDRLCAGCPEAETCTCMKEQSAAERADKVLQAMLCSTDDAALEGLRGLGCARLYHLRSAMVQCMMHVREHEKAVCRACYEHDMQATHLTALAEAVRRLAVISTADRWDAAQGKRLQRCAAELAIPARLKYVRRINGHVQTGWLAEDGADKHVLCGNLAAVISSVLRVPCASPRQEGKLICVDEAPLFRVDAGSATRGKIDDCTQNGDTVRMSMLPEGRFLAALSDGMGHGAEAQRESGHATALLNLCLEAGYTRDKALAVVNGMMLAAAQGERFATVDLMTLDLWTGAMTLDKLGAANSYLIRNGEITCLSGDALPLGILEQAEARTCEMRLQHDDMMLMMTDGVEESFATHEALENAVRTAAACMTAQAAAQSLLAAAGSEEAPPCDDQTVVALRVIRQSPRISFPTEQPIGYARRTKWVYNAAKRLYNRREIQLTGVQKDAERNRDTAAESPDAP